MMARHALRLTYHTTPGEHTMMTYHIRRTDEVNVTECGRLTDYDAQITDTPIGAGKRGHRAIFPDVETPADGRICAACDRAYMAI
jgi:hypothetical protein